MNAVDSRTVRMQALHFAAIGVACGLRSTVGPAGALLTRSRGKPTFGNAAAAAAPVVPEFIADKLPQTPSRLSPPGLAVRLAAGGTGAFVLAKRERADRASAAVTGALGAAAGSFGGYRWRQWAGGHIPDWQAALAEDAIALSLAIAAFRDGGRS